MKSEGATFFIEILVSMETEPKGKIWAIKDISFCTNLEASIMYKCQCHDFKNS